MDINLSYNLLAILYILMVVQKLIDFKLESNVRKKHDNYKEFHIYKKDFLYMIATTTIFVIIAISLLVFIGGTPYNINGPILVVLLNILAIVSIHSKFFVLPSENVVIFGEEIKKENIEIMKTFKRSIGGNKYIIYVKPKPDKEHFQCYEFYSTSDKLREALDLPEPKDKKTAKEEAKELAKKEAHELNNN